MEPEITELAKEQGDKFANLKEVTPLSKYLAMVLFIIMPFIGGWIGYTYAPEKVVEVERVVEIEKVIPVKFSDSNPVDSGQKNIRPFKELRDEYYSISDNWEDLEKGVIDLWFATKTNEELMFYEDTKNIVFNKSLWVYFDTGLGFNFKIPANLLEIDVEDEDKEDGLNFVNINVDFSHDYYSLDDDNLLIDIIFTAVVLIDLSIEEVIDEIYYRCEIYSCEGKTILAIDDTNINGQRAKYVSWNYDGSADYFTPSPVPMSDVLIQTPDNKTLIFLGPEGDVGKFVNRQIGDIFFEVVSKVSFIEDMKATNMD